VNTFNANFNPDGTIPLNGYVHAYKEVHRNMGFCTARGWAWSDSGWTGQLALTLQGTNIVPSVSSPSANPNSGTGQNACAEAWSIIGEILGALLSLLAGFTGVNFLMNLFGNLLGIPIPGIGDISTALANFSGSVSGVVVLPAGDVFAFQSIGLDPLGDTSFEVSYPKKPLKAYRAFEREADLVPA